MPRVASWLMVTQPLFEAWMMGPMSYTCLVNHDAAAKRMDVCLGALSCPSKACVVHRHAWNDAVVPGLDVDQSLAQQEVHHVRGMRTPCQHALIASAF
eukprot:480401-Pyramimonas_sp.AAC.1